MNIAQALQRLIKDVREALGLVNGDYRALEKRVKALEDAAREGK